ncbi:MAG: branched-chain amino acid ABC transporter permease [Microthrixaceae bacterium]|nr:branched-chain amino acid ABC transporter permease [Microthrixaceae bacterium]
MRSTTPNWLRWGGGALIAVVLIALPFQFEAFRVNQFITWMCIAVAAAGLNLLTGYNGQISVGHGALYGLGAYAAAILVTRTTVPMLLTIVIAAVICFVAGVAIGLPALRIKGLYLALVTLAVAVLFPALVEQFSSLTGGGRGLALVVPQEGCPRGRPECPVRWESPFGGLENDQWRYFLALAITVVAFVLVANLVKSRVGRSLVAIRDNDIAAESSGINVSRTKIITFGVSAAIAGVGGGMLALLNGNPRVNPTSFTLLVSIYLLVAVVVGGASTVIGPAIGALVYGVFTDVIGPELPGRFENATPVILGVLLIIQMLVAPNGIVGQFKEIQAKMASRRSGGAPEVHNGATPVERDTP